MVHFWLATLVSVFSARRTATPGLWAIVPVAAIVTTATLFGLFAINTRPSAAGDGFAFDGLEYYKVAVAFRTGENTLPSGPFAYRVLSPAIVAASGLEPHLGFLTLDVIAVLGAALLLTSLLRHLGASPTGALVAVLWWGLLPYGIRVQLRNPALVDAPAFFMLVAVILAATLRRRAAFAVLLLLGVLTRESLLLLAPLPALGGSQRPKELVKAIALAVPAIAALVAIHLFPPVTPRPGSASTLEFVAFQINALRTNTDDTAWRALAAVPLSLGLLIAPLIAFPRTVIRYLGSLPGWTYLTFVLAFASVIGGRDNDRYLFSASVALLPAAFVAIHAPWGRPLIAIALTALHVGATRAFLPWTDASDLTSGWSPPALVAAAAIPVLILCMTGALLWRAAGGRSQVSRADAAPGGARAGPYATNQ